MEFTKFTRLDALLSNKANKNFLNKRQKKCRKKLKLGLNQGSIARKVMECTIRWLEGLSIKPGEKKKKKQDKTNH